ncbi:DUF2807 domain-containing protein [Dokdonella koreensis]|uniref:Secreted protein n=1 Tax=Dokdonella koreensis DS-123 TaxID=1300342 RepID=A0A160DXR3_9GAMM|nr:DUF2807 domain-containing protein [Dokdonella koreensis]ANB18763.1 Putative secreted protein [Dokdonella koreensis DS-123]
MSRVLLSVLLSLTSTAAFADSCAFSAQRTLDIDAAGLKTAAFRLEANDMKLEGVAGLARIEVRGRACASEQAGLDGLAIKDSRSGDRASLWVERTGPSSGLFGSNYAYIDLTVRVPAQLLVEVDAGSGDAEIRDVAGLSFVSGSGDLEASRIAGAVAVKVGSGDAELDTIGSLQLRAAGSGDVKAQRVSGPVSVGQVGSGDLAFTDVAGDVRVERIGSGDVTVRDIVGNVSVGSIGSGDVTARGVRGDLTVEAQRSGSVYHSDVSGRVSVPESR